MAGLGTDELRISQQMSARDGEKPQRPYGVVHVVTVLHNNAGTLRLYFDALRPSTQWIAGLTIIDNGSNDESLAIAEELARSASFEVEVIASDNAGFAGGYRTAGQSAIRRGVPVLCLNPDVELSADALKNLLEAMNAVPGAAVVTLPLIESDGRPDSASRRRLPKLGASVLYSVLGPFTPTSIRYNDLKASDGQVIGYTASGLAVTSLEATTGALMMVDPAFRRLDDGVFDTDYWMYGEDLQLCRDAALAGRSVVMVECAPSTHIKGVSSGRPRSTLSNKAFHDAMYLYAEKNLVSGELALRIFRAAVTAHFIVTGQWQQGHARCPLTRLRTRLSV